MAQMFPSIGEKRPKMPVFTVEECPKCGTKTKRAFKNGDYVYKEGSDCPKCGTKTLITQIFAELIKIQ
jgi:rRNA maturation protein Nop10